MAISHEEQRLPAILKNNFGFQPSPFGCINNLFYFIYPLLYESFFVETVFFSKFCVVQVTEKLYFFSNLLSKQNGEIFCNFFVFRIHQTV